MSRIACVWADLGDDNTAAHEWYEDSHVTDLSTQLGATAHNGDAVEDNMFKEVAGIRGTCMTLYDLPSTEGTEDVHSGVRDEVAKFSPDARLDARVYKEFACIAGEDWRDDARDVQMWIVVIWQPAEAIHDQFVDWFKGEFIPGMLESPELLRARLFKLESASRMQDQTHEERNISSIFRYLTIWEFDCDEIPWEVLLYLGSSEKWREYVEGGNFNWQIGQYLVNRHYPELPETDTPATEEEAEEEENNQPLAMTDDLGEAQRHLNGHDDKAPSPIPNAHYSDLLGGHNDSIDAIIGNFNASVHVHEHEQLGGEHPKVLGE